MHDVLFKSLIDWLSDAGAELGADGPAFRAVNKGDRLTERGIQASDVGRLVAELGHRGGLAQARGTGRLSPHDLRRTAARNAFENGASLLLVQAMLGHAEPQTTALYIGSIENDAETAVDFVRY